MRSMNENYRLRCLDRTVGFVPDLHLRMCFDRGPQEKLNKMPFRKFPERKLGRNPFRRRVQGQKLSAAPDFRFPGEETWNVDQMCDAFGRFPEFLLRKFPYSNSSLRKFPEKKFRRTLRRIWNSNKEISWRASEESCDRKIIYAIDE